MKPAIQCQFTFDEAKALFAEIRDAQDNWMELVIKAHDGEAWKAAGYSSWDECARLELKISKRHANRILQYSKVYEVLALEVGPRGPTPTEKQARPLTTLKDPDHQREAWKTAVAASDTGKPTARQVAAVVDEIKAKTNRDDLTGVRPIPEIKLSAEDAAAVEQAGKDSGELWLIKFHWRQATKKERLDAMKYFADEANDKDRAAYRACWKEKP